MAKLNPSTQHEDYADYSPKWDKCSDAIEGEDAVHEAGEEYLPKLSGQSKTDYEAYVKRAPFYNATARTIDGLVGLLFRKDPMLEAPAAMQDLIDDMTLTNCDFNEFAEGITREIVGIGRMGVLVEYPQVATAGMTQAQASQLNLRPYCTTYDADCIINWREQRVNNIMQPTMVALSEEVTVYANEFEAVEVDQIRALLLIDGVYLQRVYQQDNKKEWVQVGDDIIPLMNNAALNYIPFVCFNANGNTLGIGKPPLMDLVNLNLSHYRTTADLEHGCHFTGLPTAIVSGYQAETGEKLSIGSSSAWIFPDPAAKASYLEFTGQGLGALENRLAAKEAGMAAIGARMLAQEKSSAEASQTVRMRHMGESAVLSSIGGMVSAGLTRVLAIMAQWSGVSDAVKVDLNNDFVDVSLSAQELTAMVGAWQAGAMSLDTLLYNFKQGEYIADDVTIEDEKDLIATQAPQLGVV